MVGFSWKSFKEAVTLSEQDWSYLKKTSEEVYARSLGDLSSRRMNHASNRDKLSAAIGDILDGSPSLHSLAESQKEVVRTHLRRLASAWGSGRLKDLKKQQDPVSQTLEKGIGKAKPAEKQWPRERHQSLPPAPSAPRSTRASKPKPQTPPTSSADSPLSDDSLPPTAASETLETSTIPPSDALPLRAASNTSTIPLSDPLPLRAASNTSTIPPSDPLPLRKASNTSTMPPDDPVPLGAASKTNTTPASALLLFRAASETRAIPPSDLVPPGAASNSSAIPPNDPLPLRAAFNTSTIPSDDLLPPTAALKTSTIPPNDPLLLRAASNTSTIPSDDPLPPTAALKTSTIPPNDSASSIAASQETPKSFPALLRSTAAIMQQSSLLPPGPAKLLTESLIPTPLDPLRISVKTNADYVPKPDNMDLMDWIAYKRRLGESVILEATGPKRKANTDGPHNYKRIAADGRKSRDGPNAEAESRSHSQSQSQSGQAGGAAEEGNRRRSFAMDPLAQQEYSRRIGGSFFLS